MRKIKNFIKKMLHILFMFFIQIQNHLNAQTICSYGSVYNGISCVGN
jgi:hypothetical protein